MRITQGTFSFLPDLTDEQIAAQVAYSLDNNWAIMVEHTDDPHPRNAYWEMWAQPLFDLDASEADKSLEQVAQAREAYPQRYIKVVAYDRSLGRQTSALSIIVNRPDEEPGFRLERTQKADRQIRYSLHSYATEQPHGRRYGAEGSLSSNERSAESAAEIGQDGSENGGAPEAAESSET
ncbi:MAG: ribulose bisphosphate carboxylase small subunit [Solirubrobacteraceae bacterium]